MQEGSIQTTSGSVFALVDCNNFYASCERVFNPALRGEPVVVLSNNDGCVIARSEEAKERGIPMGAPYFQIREELEANEVHVFSSNYALYGDMSRRVIDVLEGYTPEVEEYSIDEVFLGLDGFEDRDLTRYGRTIRNAVTRATGIPVSIGIAPTKTLTKVAMEFAKHNPNRGGVENTRDWSDLDHRLARMDVEAVWGIGPRYAAACRDAGIQTALDLKQADRQWVRDRLTVTGLRRVYELCGTSCIPLEDCPDPKKNVACSRSFSERITRIEDMREAVALYATRAAEKIREQDLATSVIQVFLRTGRFDDGPYHHDSAVRGLHHPVDSTSRIVRESLRAVESVFEPGYRYKKAGVMLCDLVPRGSAQRGLWDASAPLENRAVTEVMDSINDRFGRGTLQLGASGLERPWHMDRDFLSKRFTTRWDELPVVKAG